MFVDIKALKELTKEFKVLYVEDEKTIQIQIQKLLNKFFKSVTLGKNGEDGLKKYKEESFDIIITDIMMPIMNGFKMIEEIKKIDKNQKILITSASQEVNYFLEAIKYNIDGYIIKPLDKNQFLIELEKVCITLKEHKENLNYKLRLEDMVREKTLELERESKHLQKELTTDSLTNLYSKSKLKIDLKDIKESKEYIVALINIDNFSKINLTYGYSIGDKILIKVANFLKNNLKDKLSSVYRFNSDEFIYLFKESNLKDVENFINELKYKFSKNDFYSKNIHFKLSFTASIVETESKNLINMAQIGLEKIRLIGKNRVIIFTGDEELKKEFQSNLYWMHKVNSSLEYDLITPFYQPIINNRTLKCNKYECLARIIEKDKVIEPYYFISPAKAIGLIPNITKTVIEKSFRKFSGRKNLNFSINITEEDLREEYLLNIFKEFLDIYDIEPEMVILEILEDISVYSSSETFKQIQKLKEIGFSIALDDFGAERANFSKILDLNVDYIKIDKIFIEDIAINKKSLLITESIVDMAKKFNIKSIAEYVHNRETFEIVSKIGVDFSQGYYFSKPKPDL